MPTDKQILGDLAKKSKPAIFQGIVSAEKETQKEFEKKLFIFRKSLEKKIKEIDFLNIHINSCSSKTVVYKGLFTATQTADFIGTLEIHFTKQDLEFFIKDFLQIHHQLGTRHNLSACLLTMVR